MRLRPDTLALTALLATLTALGPLSTDMYLPSLPDISRLLSATTAETQLTLSAFLVGFALGQVAYGPISDKYGRKPVLIAALLVYSAASAACAFAASIEQLIAARFVQAIGACGPIVLARAIVRDLYSGPRAGQELARMGTIMGLVPAVAPILGGLLHVAFGWRSNFVATLAFGLGTALAVQLLMPETLRERSTASVSPLGILRTYGEISRNRAYLAYLAIFSFAYAGLFAFISASSFVLQELYRLSPEVFGAAFGFTVIGYIAGTVAGGRTTARKGLDVAIGVGVACLALAGLLMNLGVAVGPGDGGARAFLVLVPMALYTFGVGFVMPQSMAAALTPFPDKAGAASSLVGFVQMSFAALTGVAVGHALGGSAWPMALTLALMGFAAAMVYLVSRRVRAGDTLTPR